MSRMARHRSHPHGRRVAPRTRPRYGRIGAAAVSTLVTMVAVLAGAGALPTSNAAPSTGVASGSVGGADDSASLADSDTSLDGETTGKRSARERADARADARAGARSQAKADEARAKVLERHALEAEEALPADSGSGRRVVFDMDRQRVWLVDANDEVQRTYPVSGSVTDNLEAGSYSVYSRSLHAVGIDDSGTMNYMVRFTQGDNAAIGFHDIPVKDGVPAQTEAALGTPQSHGCVRQARPDAKAMWAFADYGTPVIVTG